MFASIINVPASVMSYYGMCSRYPIGKIHRPKVGLDLSLLQLKMHCELSEISYLISLDRH